MATKEKEVKREVKFEYCSELSVDEYKYLRKHANFPKLSDERLYKIYSTNWRRITSYASQYGPMVKRTSGKARI